jgi:polyisoprenoid-binding protein YceI
MKNLILLLMFTAMPAWAAIEGLSTQGGRVEILATGRPSFLKIAGVGSAPQGKLSVNATQVSGEIDFDLGSLDTGISKRDEHMKTKYLEIEKFPKARLTIQTVQLTPGWTLKNPELNESSFEGELTLHGVTHKVSGKFSLSQSRAVDAQFTVKLSDFKVEVPTFAGVTVADDVKIHVTIEKLNSI